MTSKKHLQELDSSALIARECGDNIEKMMNFMANKSDEAKMIFWSLFFGKCIVTAVRSVSKQTTLMILNNLISALQDSEINSKPH